MSTNYYLRNRKEYIYHREEMNKRNQVINVFLNQLKEWNAAEENIYDVQFRIESLTNVGYEEIHIGKRSGGWKPLFEKQPQFKSVKELKDFYAKNEDVYEIVDEYGTVHTWEELKNELIDWPGEKENGDRSDNYRDAEGYVWAEYQFS
ncbi:hypothetical protein F4V43_02315 [Paenibacillus spiritus]|uniref:Uncharacterized protein n=1 Tax=Paenibacillus spiritus TaxID=2496557 RepID=A0A5J5GH58_9BACL|nr:hypothetical protein [Paenibacillus spiritus]KAA9007340.1 hypothetical protein F4V43_02315 [Paenibacillus spiritus]